MRRWRGAGAAAALLVLGGCAEMSGMEARARFLSEPPCTDAFFPVYFARGSAVLQGAAARVIREAGEHARDCAVASVEVTGLAAPAATGEPRLALSRQRAARLAAALTAAGLAPTAFHLTALGDDAPAGSGAPRRRRADVYVRFRR